MAWVKVAEGISLGDLEVAIADMELQKGDRLKIIMNTPAPWLFDVAGAEHIFKPFMPPGMDLVDVWGEGNQGIVEMEADPAWLVAVLLFMKAHWFSIIIAGFLLTAIITSIIVMAKIAQAPPLPISITALVVGGIVLIALIMSRSPPQRSKDNASKI